MSVKIRFFIISQVHYVDEYSFVQIFWGFAKLYIFGILRAWGIQKSLLPFAQTPARPPFWTFKMAAIIYVFCSILASRQLRNLIKYANPMFFGSRNPIKTSRFSSESFNSAPKCWTGK